MNGCSSLEKGQKGNGILHKRKNKKCMVSLMSNLILFAKWEDRNEISH